MLSFGKVKMKNFEKKIKNVGKFCEMVGIWFFGLPRIATQFSQ